MASWLALHRIALNRGFLIKRHGVSTDTAFALIVGCTTTAWTLKVLLLSSNDDASPSALSRAAHVPLLIQTLFILWVLSYIDALWARRRDNNDFLLWNLKATRGPFDWRHSVNNVAYQIITILLSMVISIASIFSIIEGDQIQGVFNIIGLAVFLFSGTRSNPYIKATHRYQADMLRIILPTSHHEGTIYVLPSANYGFDAVWSPKVEDENIEADQQAMALFQSLRSEKWSLKEPLERIRHIVASYQERVVMTTDQLEALARWIYLEDSDATQVMRSLRCLRAKDMHLIGRDLMFALCHAEYLVFMGQGRLSHEMQRKIGSLRLMKRSGASLDGASNSGCIGYKAGYEGYREAVEYVYSLFNEPLDHSAVSFGCAPPLFSQALSKTPASINDYVADLWDISCLHSESTFTALYMFTLVWSIELGNCNGFHLFPLRCRDREGDLVSHQIVWRQAWYSGVISQLLSVTPLFFGAFVGGYL